MKSFKNTLLAFIDAPSFFLPECSAVRGMIQFCKSMRAHYRGKGLNVVVLDGSEKADANFVYDAALGELPLVIKGAREYAAVYGVTDLPFLVLIDSEGQVAWKYKGSPRAYTLAFAIEAMVGEPDYRSKDDRYNEETLPFFDHTTPSITVAFDTPKGNKGEYYISSQEDFDAIKNNAFSPGDTLYFARGKTFKGMFMPSGAGSGDKPIRLSSYGVGQRPVIDGGREPGAIVLFNTEGWEIDGINVTGGRCWGIFVGSDYKDLRVLSNFTIRNCSAYKVGYEWPTIRNDAFSAPICFSIYDARTGEMAAVNWNNVLIENCESYNTTRGEGIYVNGAYKTVSRNENVTVQNCFVHNTGFDGILVICSKNVLIKDNVVFHTGLSPVRTGFSPVCIWTWRCTDVLVTGNEASFAHSPEYNNDGGAFDIDFYNKNNIYEYNYAHDNETFGISVYGADQVEDGAALPDDHITTNSIVRHNYFGNNQVVGWGEIYFATWDGGCIDGFEVYNNFVYSNPVDKQQPAITFPTVEWAGELPRLFHNNIICSAIGYFANIACAEDVLFYSNQYYSDADSLKWSWANSDFDTFTNFVKETGQEQGGSFTQGKPGIVLAE